MGDFNAEEANIQVPTCFKNPGNPKTIDLMLTHSESAAFKTHVHLKQVFLSDFHKMKQLKIISYRDFLGKFSNNDFRTQILRNFSTLHLSNDSLFLDLYVIFPLGLLISMPQKRKILEPIAVLL